MRKDLFIHTQKLSQDFFDRTDTGELMSRIKDDVDKIWDGLSYVSMLLIEVVIHTSIVLFCMYTTNVKLAIIPTVAMIFCGCIALIMERKLGAVYEEISEEKCRVKYCCGRKSCRSQNSLRHLPEKNLKLKNF